MAKIFKLVGKFALSERKIFSNLKIKIAMAKRKFTTKKGTGKIDDAADAKETKSFMWIVFAAVVLLVAIVYFLSR